MKLQKLFKSFELDLCGADNPPEEILEKRKMSLQKFESKVRRENSFDSFPDMNFYNQFRVPFPFLKQVLKLNQSSLLIDEDVSHYDAFSSYGVNILGKNYYEQFIKNAIENNDKYGFFLNSIHPITIENIKILKEISDMDAVSFHMSGTEAVLNACRLAKFNTGKKYIYKFKGSYHGWASIPNLREIKTLKELKKSNNCAAVLINPLQYLYPNDSVKADALLFIGNDPNKLSIDEYRNFLHEVRSICNQKKILMIIDEIFMGFRLAYGGCQEYFGVKADMVLYGKTLGGGLPVGVVCGKKEYMRKYDPDYPLAFLPNRGTFSAHPLVMLSMNQFLKHIKKENYNGVDERWNLRVQELNTKISRYGLKFNNLGSILSIVHKNHSIYNWVLQLYFKKNKLYLGPYGSSRLILKVFMDCDEWKIFENIIIISIEEMEMDGWLYSKFKNKKEIYLFYLKILLKETIKNAYN